MDCIQIRIRYKFMNLPSTLSCSPVKPKKIKFIGGINKISQHFIFLTINSTE